MLGSKLIFLGIKKPPLQYQKRQKNLANLMGVVSESSRHKFIAQNRLHSTFVFLSYITTQSYVFEPNQLEKGPMPH